MNKKRGILFKALAVLLLIVIAVAMFIIGRGHTVYLDNKTMEYNGQSYKAYYKVLAFVDGEQVAKLYAKERGMATCIGQSFQVTLQITAEKGGSETAQKVTLSLPQNMDGIIVNLPALLAGLPEEAYLSEFVAAVPAAEPAEEEIVTDEFGIVGTEAETGEPVA